ncbi:TOBE domain-containing protein [Micromonospora chalcea]
MAEHIALGGDDDTAAMRGRISHVEFTGMATNISVDVDGNEVMAALIDAPAGLQLGDVVGLRLVPERLWVVKP